MKPKPLNSRQYELFASRLDSILDSKHPLVELSKKIEWKKFEDRVGEKCCPNNGRPDPKQLSAQFAGIAFWENSSQREHLTASI